MRVVAEGPDSVEDAAAVLNGGGLVVVPTDTVYGVAVRGDRHAAAHILAEAKARPDDQPIALIVASVGQAEEVAELDDRARAIAQAFWPGPITMVVPRRPTLDWDLGRPYDTVGLRQPGAPFLIDLAQHVGPLAVTSANRHGQRTADTATAAAATLLSPVDLVVDGGSCAGAPSTVVDLARDGPTIAREGTISAARVREIIDRH